MLAIVVSPQPEGCRALRGGVGSYKANIFLTLREVPISGNNLVVAEDLAGLQNLSGLE